MSKRKILWFLCFLIVFLVVSFVLIPVSPVGRYQTIYAGSYAGYADNRLSDEQIGIIVLINNQRAENNAKNLWYSEALGEIATIRAYDMLNRNYFSHYTPEGTTVFDLLRANNIKYRSAGENLARGYPSEYVTPENVINAILNSPSHRNNLLEKRYSKIGVGIEVQGKEKVVVLVFTD